MFDMRFRPNVSSTVKNGRTYRFFNGIPRYPFGYGLSYTNFVIKPESVDDHAYSNLKIPATKIRKSLADHNARAKRWQQDFLIKVPVTLKNVGLRAVRIHFL